MSLNKILILNWTISTVKKVCQCSETNFESHRKIYEYGKYFYVISNEVIVLDSNICVAEIFLKMIRDIEAIGKRQHVTFKRHVFQIDKGVQSPIKRTEIPVFQFHTTNKKSSTAKNLE